MTPRQVRTLAQDLAGQSAHAIDAELQHRHLDAQDRLAVRVELEAQAQRELSASLATDDAEWHPAERPMQPLTEIERLMQRAGLQPGRQYTEADIDEGCRLAGIVDPTEKLAVKVESEMRHMLKTGPAAHDSWRPSGSMRASAERPRGKLLVDADGRPRMLRSVP